LTLQADRQTIATKLSDPDQEIRLSAARELAADIAAGDVQLIRTALASEEVSWVRQALTEGLANALVLATPDRELADTQLGTSLKREGYVQALRDVTRELAHELSPLIGALDYFAATEMEESYDDSKTAKAVERLRGAIEAIRNLSSAAGQPRYEEVVLSECVAGIIEAEGQTGVPVSQSGDSELVVRGDQALLDLAISNGLRNAIEATLSLPNVNPEQRPIVIAWGETDIDYWITVRDEGIGLPESRDRAFELGVTNKSEHLGMGLAIARSAASSLEGTLDLRAGDHEGTVFELRWPKSGAAK
jgi:signal transduction histidine kinase